MRLKNFKNLMNATQAAALVASCLFIMSCTKGGSITSSSSGSAVDGTLTLSTVYPTPSGNTWTPITSGSRVYIKGLDVTIEGICTRGIATIKVNEGGSDYAETATCADDGSFIWNKVYAATAGEGDKTLHFTAYDSTGLLITAATATQDARIDATAPTVPVVTSPAATPYSHAGAIGQYTILGTVSADCDHLTGPGGVVITPTGTNWSYDATLTSGATVNFTFYSWDLAGNQSPGFTQQIIWAPNVIMYAAGAMSGGMQTDSGVSGFTLESTQDSPSGPTSDVFTSYSLKTGFNYIINVVRGL